MTCEEFKNQVIDLLDRSDAPHLTPEGRKHLNECASCARYFHDMQATADLLRPHHSPYRSVQPQHPRSTRPFLQRIWQPVAAVALFLLGVGVGLSNLFSTRAQASQTDAPALLEQGTRHLENVGNYQITLEVRACPDENFSTFDPEAPFIAMRLFMLHQNDSAFWRVEKANGRTVMFDGNDQYLWTANGLRMKGGADAGFVESQIRPENLLKQQALLLPGTTHSESRLTYTDESVILSTEGQTDEAWEEPCNYRIETEFDKSSSRLRRMEVWMKHNGKDVQIVRSTGVRYNTALTRADVVRQPDTNGTADWQDVRLPQVESRKTRKALQKETAPEAARRILRALIDNRPQDAREALYYYRQVLPQLTKNMKGCTVSDFGSPTTKKDYPGVFVPCRLTTPQGETSTLHIALRRDNEQRIWVLDGGL